MCKSECTVQLPCSCGSGSNKGQTPLQLTSLQVCIPASTGHKVTLCFYGCSPWCSAQPPEMTKSLSWCLWPQASLSGPRRSHSLMWTPNWNRSSASFQGLIPPLQACGSPGSAVGQILSDCLSVLFIFSGGIVSAITLTKKNKQKNSSKSTSCHAKVCLCHPATFVQIQLAW